MKFIFCVSFLILFITGLDGQHISCGLRLDEAIELKRDMIQNRNRFPLISNANLKNSLPLYLPLHIQIVGNQQGIGFANPQAVLSMVCRLNTDFADQNIQFYIKDSLSYLMNDSIYIDAYDSTAVDSMIAHKDTNAINIYINGLAGGGVAGYYSRRGDYVFMLNAYANGGSTTITHEMGHFFTLPHTFFGWEKLDARALYANQPAPDSIGSSWWRRAVEKVTRNPGSYNCYDAGDGFCDTPADYISEREQCPMPGRALDPDTVAIQPNTALYMSYFYDQCMDSFTTEQKNAINASIIQRNWNQLPPITIDSISWTQLTLTQPTNNQNVLITSPNPVRFSWDRNSVPTATSFIVLVERMLFGTPIGTVFQRVVNQQDFIDIPSSVFLQNANYRWSVLPFNQGFVCSNFCNPQFFSTQISTGIENEEDAQSKVLIFPNPSSEVLHVQWKYEGPEPFFMELFNSLGQKIELSSGIENTIHDNSFQIDISSLAKGIYYIRFYQQNQQFTKSFYKK